MDFDGWKGIPADIRKQMRYVGSVSNNGGRPVRFLCEKYEIVVGGVLWMTNVLTDTSDQLQGQVVAERYSHINELLIGGGGHAWTLRPISLEEM